MVFSSVFARGVWPLRGIRIGKASNPGPREVVDLDDEETQETAEGATPAGALHAGPEFEFVS